MIGSNIEALRATGDFRDEAYAKILEGVLQARGQDLTLNGIAEKPPVEIVKFTDEARVALKKQKFVVYELTGESIKSLRDSDRKFLSTWHQSYPDFEALTSRLSEVAINPDPKKFYLPNSNRKTLEDQLELVKKFSESLTKGRKRVPGVEAILGEVPDYVELAFTHLDRTGERLFGEKFQRDGFWSYTRTITSVGGRVARVGRFLAGDGLDVDRWEPPGVDDDLWAAPLVVPVENR